MLFFGKSDIGKKRATNQDNFITLKLCVNLILCVICDGMGGVHGGSIASELAISSFTEFIKVNLAPYIDTERAVFNAASAASAGIEYGALLAGAVGEANAAVKARSKNDHSLDGMGTTLLAALIVDNILYIANVGDSRLYFISGGEIKQITRDHSYVQYLVDIGKITQEEAASSPYKNIITRAVGTDDEIDADIFKLEYNSGALLMCSDGLYNVTEPELYIKLAGDIRDPESLACAVNKLIEHANDNGGPDNITAVIIKNDNDI